MAKYQHGDKARYIHDGSPFPEVKQGEVYTVFGNYPHIGQPERRDLSIYVPDPRDDFGGVLSLPVEHFEPVKPEGDWQI